MHSESTPVLIVGGGLVGLSAAAFLSWRGVRNTVIERRARSSPHPRAMGFTEHTMEFFRVIGLGDLIPQVPADFRLRRARVESLAGQWYDESAWTPQQALKPKVQYSPCTGAAIAQDSLEPLLRNKAVELGTDLRQRTELVRFEQDSDGVSALVRDLTRGSEYTLRAQYMIAADGHRSSVREALGITRQGRGHIQTIRSVLFRAPGADIYLDKGVVQFEIEQPDLKAFLTTYHDSRWVLMVTDDRERDAGELREAVFKALGRTDIAMAIITTGRWELSALICDQYAAGRVFLAGDAAHTLPPTRGGFGANTGIDDVHNLAWKLESVLSGRSTPQLLETYNAERQPIGWLRHQQTFARPDYAQSSAGIAKDETILDDAALELGQLLRSTAVIGASSDLPPARRPDEWAGQAGVRAPHVWVTRHGARVSTVDLFQKGWVLLSEDACWKPAAQSAGQQLGVEVEVLLVGAEVQFPDPGVFQAAFGVGASGATLVRPDGVVAWRTRDVPTDPSQALTEVLGQVLCHQR